MKVGQKKMGAGTFGSDLMFWVKAILPLLLIEYVILFSCLEAKFGRGFQHARYVVDNNRRIPLWYPYEVHENYGTIELAYWGGRGNDDVLLRESRPAEGGPIQPLLKLADGIVDFQIGTNVVCGTRDVRSQKGRERFEDNPVVGIQYFLFATNMNAVACFEDEMEYLRRCSSYGIDGKMRKCFEANFTDFSNRPEERRTLGNFLYSLLKSPLSREGKELLFFLMGVPFIVWLLIVWACWSRHASKEEKD